jgi:hypothetical protein
MKLSILQEARYQNKGSVVEQKFAIYDLKANAFIQSNDNNQTGISRRGSFTQGDGVTWFETEEGAQFYIDNIKTTLQTTRYKAGSKYKQRGNYRYNDHTIILTAKQAASKNKLMDRRAADVAGLVVVKVTATV